MSVHVSEDWASIFLDNTKFFVYEHCQSDSSKNYLVVPTMLNCLQYLYVSNAFSSSKGSLRSCDSSRYEFTTKSSFSLIFHILLSNFDATLAKGVEIKL